MLCSIAFEKKVFFDYNQNAKGKTIASVFSPRPTELATVSMPINWNDLSNISPTNFTVLNVVEILKGKQDSWKDILSQQQNLSEILDNISVFLFKQTYLIYK